jgi:hypothetical protein
MPIRWRASSPSPASSPLTPAGILVLNGGGSPGHVVGPLGAMARAADRQAAAGQDELFDVRRYHAVFTDSPFVMLQAEEQHRDHAIIEQVFADWASGSLAHLPSGSFPANAAWLTGPRSAITCCAPPGRWPASPTPKPAAPPSGPISSTLPPAPPATAAATSPCTLPQGWHRCSAPEGD